MAGVVTEWSILGVDDLVRELRRFSDTTLQNELRKVTREAVAQTIEPAVKLQAPVATGPYRAGGKARQPGRLRASVKAQATARTAKLRVGGVRDVHYTWFVHGGVPSAGIEPRPFIREGISMSYSDFIKRYREALDSIVAKFNRKYSRKAAG